MWRRKLRSHLRRPTNIRRWFLQDDLLVLVRTRSDFFRLVTQCDKFYIADDFHSGNFQLMSFGYSARIEPALMYSDVLGDKSGNPMAQWENPQARALLRSPSRVRLRNRRPGRKESVAVQAERASVAGGNVTFRAGPL